MTKSASRAYPISGGTLTVTRDGKTAVAADPDRGRVFLADLGTKAVRSVVLDEKDELGRVVEGESGIVYVVARRGGAILRIDVATGNAQRFPVCNAPRGVAYDAAKGQIHVTCVSGLLVSLDAPSGAVLRTVRLQDKGKDDLRDIVMVKDKLVITRFRSSELLTVDAATGAVVNSQTATPSNFSGRVGPSTLAFRAVTKTNGDVVVVHQSSSDTVLGTGLGAYYGGNCGGSVADTFITEFSGSSIAQNYSSPQTVALGGATGPLDVAISPDGRRTAIVATGNSWALAGDPAPGTENSKAVAGCFTVQRPTLQVVDSATSTGAAGCWDQQAKTLGETGEAVAVAFDGNSKYIVQYREPAKLILEDKTQIVRQIFAEHRLARGYRAGALPGQFGRRHRVRLVPPEGGVDGHVWKFDQFGQRITQPLQGHVSDRAPFHWSGDLAKWDNLIDEVMMKRMSMPLKPTAEQSQGLLAWLDTIPNVPAPDGLDAAKIASGRAIFEDNAVGCAACHMGATFTDNKAHDVGTGGTFVAPTLVGVGSRAPLMHDGCAATLEDRLIKTRCGGGDSHGKTSQLSDTQRGDLDHLLEVAVAPRGRASGRLARCLRATHRPILGRRVDDIRCRVFLALKLEH